MESSQRDRVLRFPEVREVTGLGRTTVWKLEKAGQFPKRIQLSAGAVGWVESEVIQWVTQRQRGTLPLRGGNHVRKIS